MKTFNRRRPHSSLSVRALARERNDGANERTRDRWNVDVSRLDAMTRRTVRIGSIRFVQKSARRINERTSGMIVFCRRESRNQKARGGGYFILGSRLYYSLSHEASTRPPRDDTYATSVMMDDAFESSRAVTGCISRV